MKKNSKSKNPRQKSALEIPDQDGGARTSPKPLRATIPLPEQSDRRGFSYRAPANPEDEVAVDAARRASDEQRSKGEEAADNEGTILPAHWKRTG